MTRLAPLGTETEGTDGGALMGKKKGGKEGQKKSGEKDEDGPESLPKMRTERRVYPVRQMSTVARVNP